MQEEVSKSFAQRPNPWGEKEIKYPYKLIVNPPPPSRDHFKVNLKRQIML